MTGRALLLLLAITALAAPASAVAHQAHCDSPPPADLTGNHLRLVPLGAFAAPVSLASPPGRRLLYVAERNGRVMILEHGQAVSEPFLDLSSEIAPTVSAMFNERGMQSIAFDPGYPRVRLVYVGYSDADGDFRVDSFGVSAGGKHALIATRRNLLRVEHSVTATHYGGQVAFGPDGLLYVSLGDEELRGRAQGRGPYGKVLRLDPRHPARTTYVATGLRNPYRFSFDRSRGDLVLGDVGEDHYEEVDFLPKGRKGIANFGWPLFEGPERFKGESGPVPAGYVAPVLSLEHPYVTAVVGGFVARDPQMPAYAGRYVFGDFCDGWVASTKLLPKTHDTRFEGLTVPYLSTFGQDSRGRLYAASLAGGVYAVRSR
jgi:glucose/arabinose dehydrogenase